MDSLFSLHMDKIAAIKMLPDEQIGKVIKLLIEYQETGDVKNIDPVVGFPFEILRQSLEVLNQKRAGTSKKQSDRVKNRWQSKDTAVYHGIPQDTTAYETIPDDTTGYQTIPDDTNTVTEKDTVTVKDSEKINLDSGGGSSQNESNQPPPPPIELIIQEVDALGFFVDDLKAREILNSAIDPSWLTGPHSFMKFCAERVRKRYPNKDDEELKPVFIKAVKSWPDLRRAYPPWRAKQEKTAAAEVIAAEKAQAIRQVRDNAPKTCEGCGGKLNGRLGCETCGGYYRFDEKIMEYIFDSPSGSLSEEYKKQLQKKHE